MTLNELLTTLPQRGSVVWIGLRPQRGAAPVSVAEAELTPEQGLLGDRYRRTNGKRQVTLIQYEHLAAVASLAGLADVDPTLLRRNVVVRGVNLLALRQQRFRLGDALLETTGLCHPCARMEQALGAGGYNAMRGHGGITARVLCAGSVRLGGEVRLAVDG